jgi:hypothetical protein
VDVFVLCSCATPLYMLSIKIGDAASDALASCAREATANFLTNLEERLQKRLLTEKAKAPALQPLLPGRPSCVYGGLQLPCLLAAIDPQSGHARVV